MYELDIKPEADRIFERLAKKNRKQLEIIHKKIQEIRLNPNHVYKFLSAPLQTFNRVHIDRSFVLIFKIKHQERVIEIYYYDHHDNVYKWRPKSDI